MFNLAPFLALNPSDLWLSIICFELDTFPATQEMLKIMQDYGEVVCCLGSNVNLANVPLFAQADIRLVLKLSPSDQGDSQTHMIRCKVFLQDYKSLTIPSFQFESQHWSGASVPAHLSAPDPARVQDGRRPTLAHSCRTW